jgi:hypothetical protein
LIPRRGFGAADKTKLDAQTTAASARRAARGIVLFFHRGPGKSEKNQLNLHAERASASRISSLSIVVLVASTRENNRTAGRGCLAQTFCSDTHVAQLEKRVSCFVNAHFAALISFAAPLSCAELSLCCVYSLALICSPVFD